MQGHPNYPFIETCAFYLKHHEFLPGPNGTYFGKCVVLFDSKFSIDIIGSTHRVMINHDRDEFSIQVWRTDPVKHYLYKEVDMNTALQYFRDLLGLHPIPLGGFKDSRESPELQRQIK